MKKKWIAYIIALLPFFGFSQELKLSVSKNPVAVGEEFRIEFSIDGAASEFKGPNLNGLRKLSGPNQSSSSSIQIINGKVSSSKTTSFTYYVTALNEGTLTIGEASVKSDGKTVRSQPGQMQITKANPKNKQASTYNIAENVYVKASTNKTKIYQGEQIVVSYKLYSKINLADINLKIVPELNDFWKEAIETSSNAKLEVIDGVKHNVWEMSRFILTPQKSGVLSIDPMSVNITVQIKNNRRRDPFGDPFGFFGSYQNIEEEISSKNINITVKDLPEGAPDNFNGAVGQYKLQSSVDKSSIEANQALNYKLTLSGNGNIHLIDGIEVEFPSNFETFDPHKNDKTFSTKNGIAGKIEFEHLLIPRYKGEYEIKGVDFSYFDPKTKTYNSITTKPITINVLKGTGDDNSYISSEELKNTSSNQLSDIIVSSELKQNKEVSFNKWLFIVLIAFPILGLLGFLIMLFVEAKNDANPILSKYRKSLKIAQKRLKNAQKHLENNKKEPFFEEIEKSLWSYFSNKFNVSSADLSKETINDFFAKNSISEDVSKNFTSIIEKCEFCRFAPSSLEAEDMNNVFELATKVIVEVEQDLKK
ncbi:BatD family protein [Flavobacteriales bacterium]|nr:BatD family protein [Flavobacteriales bacterium]